jgi:oligopeptide transport system substrate-binding protein
VRLSRRSASFVAMAASVALAATACGGDDGGGGGGDGDGGGTFRLGITEPTAIDPYNAQESEGILVTKQLFRGLTEATADGEVENMLAEDIESNDDCTEWTFTLKEDTTFSNGEPVDAAAFLRGWNRAALQESASDVAYHLSGIEGFSDVNGGDATEMSGAVAEDDYTLKVTLAEPDCEFDYKTTHTVYSPVPEEAGAADNAEYNDMPIGNGPFKMDGPWQHDQSITLVRNDDYGLDDTPSIDRVEIAILNPDNSIELEYQGFQADQFDWARIPTTQFSAAKQRFESQGNWLETDTNGMNYLLPITDSPPFNTLEARQAASLAIDREAIMEGVYQGLYRAGTTIVPPAFDEFHQEGLCEVCTHDPEQAKTLAEQGGAPPGTAVKLQYNTGAGHDEWMQAVAAQWKETLGWEVELVGMPFGELLEAQQAVGATGMFRFAWGADYPTPDNYLYPLLHSDAINKDETGKVVGDNRSRFENAEFDQLVKEARSTPDDAERAEKQQEAEKIAVEQLGLIPHHYRTQFRLFNSEKWADVELDFNENPNLTTLRAK